MATPDKVKKQFFMTKSFTRNQISSFRTTLKVMYSKVEFQKFHREDPRTLAQRGGEFTAPRPYLKKTHS